MPEDPKFVRMTVRVPRELSEAMDRAVEVGFFKSKNQLMVEAAKDLLRSLSLAISVQVKAKKKSRGRPLDYYRFLGEELQEILNKGFGEQYLALTERVGLVMSKYPLDVVEKLGEEIFQLINFEFEESEEDAAQGGDTPMPEDLPEDHNPGCNSRR